VLAAGRRADLVTVALDSVRTAGAQPLAGAVYAAGAADVTQVLVDGVPVVRDGRHVRLDVAGELAYVIAGVWQ
jgi:cytosine/adenosine deaminase-related metal-dependent hydrolase